MMGVVECTRQWVLRYVGASCIMMIIIIYTITMHMETERTDRRQMNYYNHSQLSIINYKNIMISDQHINETKHHVISGLHQKQMRNSLATRESSMADSNPPSSLPVKIDRTTTAVSLPESDLRPPPLTNKFIPLTQKEIEDVEMFVIFVGFARSGHSIVGTLLDAHPDIVIAHEYNVLKDIKSKLSSRNSLLGLFNSLYKNSHGNALKGWRSTEMSQKGYNLSMNGQSWQGRLYKLKVIGDKAAGMATQQHTSDPTRCPYLLHTLNSTLGISVKAIRVLRNPYDIISTRLLYKNVGKQDIIKAKNLSQPVKYNQPTALSKIIHRFFELVSHVNRMITECHLQVINVHLSELVYWPKSVMSGLCNSLGVVCSAGYLESCAGKVFEQLSKTRNLVQWSQTNIDLVAQNIEKYSEFSRYSYECDC